MISLWRVSTGAHDNELTFLKPVSNLEISIYDRRTAEYMAKTGSLFLWHLKLEGHIEYQKDSFVTAILASLSKCPDTLSELDVHKRLFYLILARRRDGEIVDIFDMSAAHTIVRNICILLCAYAGQFRFGRTDAFEKAREIYGDIGVSAYNFELMLGYHLLYQRGIEPSLQVDEGTVDRLLADVGRFVDRAKSILEVPL